MNPYTLEHTEHQQSQANIAVLLANWRETHPHKHTQCLRLVFFILFFLQLTNSLNNCKKGCSPSPRVVHKGREHSMPCISSHVKFSIWSCAEFRISQIN